MGTPQPYPVEFDVDRSRQLRIVWSDGVEHVVLLPALRRACPCALCRQERDDREKQPLRVMTLPQKATDPVTVEHAELVGNYALRIRWRDGHDSGIYDFDLLRRIAESLTSEPGGIPSHE